MSAPTFATRLQAAWLHRGTLAWALTPLSVLFGVVASLRRALFRVGLKRAERLAVPVVVVGNLIAGGAGKTPTTLALVDLLNQLHQEHGITFVTATHDINVVKAMADVVYVLVRGGEIVAQGTPRSLLDDPGLAGTYLGMRQ